MSYEIYLTAQVNLIPITTNPIFIPKINYSQPIQITSLSSSRELKDILMSIAASYEIEELFSTMDRCIYRLSTASLSLNIQILASEGRLSEADVKLIHNVMLKKISITPTHYVLFETTAPGIASYADLFWCPLDIGFSAATNGSARGKIIVELSGTYENLRYFLHYGTGEKLEQISTLIKSIPNCNLVSREVQVLH